MTVTDFVTAFVAPLSSVTVSTTEYVPAAPYVCDAVAPVVAGVSSPKFQLYDATVPSASEDADPSAATVRSVAVTDAAATGALFGTAAVPPPRR